MKKREIVTAIIANMNREQWVAMCKDSVNLGEGKNAMGYIVSKSCLLADEIIKQTNKFGDN